MDRSLHGCKFYCQAIKLHANGATTPNIVGPTVLGVVALVFM